MIFRFHMTVILPLDAETDAGSKSSENKSWIKQNKRRAKLPSLNFGVNVAGTPHSLRNICYAIRPAQQNTGIARSHGKWLRVIACARCSTSLHCFGQNTKTPPACKHHHSKEADIKHDQEISRNGDASHVNRNEILKVGWNRADFLTDRNTTKQR